MTAALVIWAFVAGAIMSTGDAMKEKCPSFEPPGIALVAFWPVAVVLMWLTGGFQKDQEQSGDWCEGSKP